MARSICLLLLYIFLYNDAFTFIPTAESTSTVKIIDLSKIDWSVSDHTETYMFRTKLPKDVYLGLYENQLIPDPYFEENDVIFRNISQLNWTFSGKFKISNENDQHFRAYLLIADQVDTISEIYINRELIGSTDNMFRSYHFDIKPYVNVPSNLIEVKFQSAVNYSRDQDNLHKQKYGYRIPPDCPPSIQHGECHVNMIRKMQASFSWDWGPAFPTVGFNGQFHLALFNTCKILQFSAVPVLDRQQQRNRQWNLNTDFTLYCADDFQGVEFSIDINQLTLRINFTRNVAKGKSTVRHTFNVKDGPSVRQWYPNQYGNQTLYNVTGSCRISEEKDEKSVRIGFRTVELIQDTVVANATPAGLTFYFKINDIPVFLKGSNWIPGDSFLSRMTRDKLEFYFRSMRDANMNAIRVWGGGVYETDAFYDLADQYGIMIWQDMMFAVSLYPGTQEFLQNVRMEVDDQVSRLKHHPCIIVWAGNNENELGMAQGWFSMDADYAVYKRDYLALYWSTIYGVINETDYYSRPYLLSSPSNGARTVASGGIDGDPSSPLFGDVHVYEYLADGWNYKSYPIPRCVTEYGFQSLPSMDTWLSAILKSHVNFDHPSVVHRQHHMAGQLELINQIVLHFRLPSCIRVGKYTRTLNEGYTAVGDYLCKTNKTSVEYFEQLIYLTQIHQAVAYKAQTEHYRRWMSTIGPDGKGKTMCALYWQLNDIWPGISWSSIDYGQQWKMAHYYAKQFFAPLLVSPVIVDNQLQVVIVSDNVVTIENLTLVIDTHIWNTFSPIYTHKQKLNPILPLSAKSVFLAPLASLMADRNPEDLSVFFNVYLTQGSSLVTLGSSGMTNDKESSKMTPESVLYPLGAFESFTAVPYGSVKIANVTSRDDDVGFEILLVATNPAPFVWLQAHHVIGWFSDNGFTMLTPRTQISFTPWSLTAKRISLKQFVKSLSVISLGDIYRRENLHT